MSGIDLPWSPRTRQVQGRVSEQRAAKRLGARLHPNSGAGKIKFDYSTDDAIFEHKDANKTHTLNAAFLMDFFRKAARQNKDAVYVVQFGNGVILTGRISREESSE